MYQQYQAIGAPFDEYIREPDWGNLPFHLDESDELDILQDDVQLIVQEKKETNIVAQQKKKTITVGQLTQSIKRRGKKILKKRKVAGVDEGKTFPDYKKNICGYVTKKVLREFLNEPYKKVVQDLCQKEHTTYEEVKIFYAPRVERVTGPSHIPGLFQFSGKQQASIPRVFIKFFNWFLKNRYVRHLIHEGKMDQKLAYIEYKNRELLPMIAQIESQMLPDQNLSTLISHQSSMEGV